MRVKATNEGLVNDATASGYIIDRFVSFVALPSRDALHRHVRVSNPLNGKAVIAEVLDVGPWNIDDNAYVFGEQRPLAEVGIKTDGKGNRITGETNKAGIDLGPYVWKALGMADNTEVDWEFV